VVGCASATGHLNFASMGQIQSKMLQLCFHFTEIKSLNLTISGTVTEVNFTDIVL
jgi:hypothetical protein